MGASNSSERDQIQGSDRSENQNPTSPNRENLIQGSSNISSQNRFTAPLPPNTQTFPASRDPRVVETTELLQQRVQATRARQMEALAQIQANAHEQMRRGQELANERMRMQQELVHQQMRSQQEQMQHQIRLQQEHSAARQAEQQQRQQAMHAELEAHISRLMQQMQTRLGAAGIIGPNLGNTHNPLPVVEVAPPPKSLTVTCCVCAEDFDKRSSEAAFIECTHWYHFNCIKEWTDKGHKNCPECRVNTAEIYRVKMPDN